MSLTGGLKAPFQRVLLIGALCCRAPFLLLCVFVAFYLLMAGCCLFLSDAFQDIILSVAKAAKGGNSWPALILVNLIGIGVPLAFRWRRKRRIAATMKMDIRAEIDAKKAAAAKVAKEARELHPPPTGAGQE